MADTKRTKITDYTPDPANPNRHTPRGVSMLEDSVSKVGVGRSIVVDENGYILAGNSTTERLVDQGFEDAIEVETDGRQLVVVRRTDLDLMGDEQRARLLSYYDNRVAQISVDFDPEQLLADVQAGMNFDGIFSELEIESIFDVGAQEREVRDAASSETSPGRNINAAGHQVRPVLYVNQVKTFEQAMSLTGIINRADALMEICESYINAKRQ